MENIAYWFSAANWTAVSGFATVIAALVTLLTVREMREDRNQRLAPELIVLPPDFRFIVRWVPREGIQAVMRPEPHPLYPQMNLQDFLSSG